MKPEASFLFTILATLGFGATTFCASQLSRAVGPLRSVFLFEVLGVPFMLVPFLLQPNLAPGLLMSTLGLGLVCTIALLLEFEALRTGLIAVVVPVLQLYVLISFILGLVLLGEESTPAKMVSVLLIVAGIVLITRRPRDPVLLASGATTSATEVRRSTFLALAAGVLLGGYFFACAPVAREYGWLGTALGIRIVISIASGLLLLRRPPSAVDAARPRIPWRLAFLTAVLDVVAFSAYNIAIVEGDVSYVTPIVSANILIPVLIAVGFLGERLNRAQTFGITAILLGLAGMHL